MQNHNKIMKIQFIQEKINSISRYLAENNYPVVEIQAEELIAYFEGEAPSGDTTTLKDVLQSKWLLIHEIVELCELKKTGYIITSDLLVSIPKIVFQAHLIATEWEFKIALKNKAKDWIKKRLEDVKNWLEDPTLQPESIIKCQELIEKYR